MGLTLPPTVTAYLAVVAAVALLRFAELAISIKHRRALKAAGATPIDEPNFKWMAALHTAILAGAAIEVVALHRPFVPALAMPALLLLIAATWTRWWVIHALGHHWNVGVMDSTRQGVVDGGPYRWVRHPNYTAVFVELLALPLVHSAWITAIAGGIAHVFVLRARVAAEDRVLLASPDYVARMGRKPRFFPDPPHPPHKPYPPRSAMTDVVIVGGGIAGASLAIALGRSGLAVALFDAQTFPRDKPCGEGIMPAGVSALRRLGVPDGAGGVAFHGVRYHAGSRVAVGRFPPSAEHGNSGRAQRRLVLDRCLFERAAATPGVTAHQGVAVEGPALDNGRVVGVLANGEVHRAALVVAADGAHSRFRHRLGLNVPVRGSRVGARRHYRLAGRTAPPWVDIFLGPSHEFYVTPLPGNDVLVALLAEADVVESPLEPLFDRWRLAPPGLRALLAGAEPISPLQATTLAAAARRGFAPGVVLLGDAAGFIDPITGGGMAQALVTSERLAHYIASQGAARADVWLPEFERDRRRILRDYRLLTRGVLALARRPALARAALAALSWTPPLFSHLVGVSAGTRSLLGSRLQPRSNGVTRTGP